MKTYWVDIPNLTNGTMELYQPVEMVKYDDIKDSLIDKEKLADIMQVLDECRKYLEDIKTLYDRHPNMIQRHPCAYVDMENWRKGILKAIEALKE